MKTFQTLFEEINQATAEEKELTVDDAGLIKSVTSKLQKIVSDFSEMSPEEAVEQIQSAVSEFNLTFDVDKALSAMQSDEPVKLKLTLADNEDDPFTISAEDEDGEEIPGDMVLCVHKDGEGIYAKIHVYFDDEEPEVLDDIKFNIPDEEESEEEKNDEAGYPALENEAESEIEKEKPVEKDDDEEETEPSAEENDSKVTRKGAIKVYEEYTGGTKYIVVHLKQNKLKADIFNHKLDAYNQGLNIVGDIIEITRGDVQDTESRMKELAKVKRQKLADVKKKMAAKMEAKKVISDANAAENKTESLPVANTEIVKKLKEKKGKDLPEPGTHQV